MLKSSDLIFSDKNYQPAEQLYFHDPLMAKTVLKLFPRSITPNQITLFRFITTPIVLILVLYNNYLIALLAFLVVSFTDAIDGSMARTRNMITEWGKVYDPLADKILVGSMVFAIVLRYIDLWTATVIVGLEIIIIITAWIRMVKGYKVQANIWGKIKMMLQVAGVTLLLFAIIFNWAALLPFASGTLYLAIAFAIVSLLTYGI